MTQPNPSRAATVGVLIIALLIAIPGGVAYYFLDWERGIPSGNTGQVIPEYQEDSGFIDDRVLLIKDRGMVVNRSRLVFRGMTKDRIRLDVYLLELDPEYAYPRYLSTTDKGKIIRLGDSTFQLIKISRQVLQLKLLDLYNS